MANIGAYIQSKLNQFRNSINDQQGFVGYNPVAKRNYLNFGPSGNQAIRTGAAELGKHEGLIPLKEVYQLTTNPVLLSKQNIRPAAGAFGKVAALATIQGLAPLAAPALSKVPIAGKALSQIATNPVGLYVKGALNPRFIATSGALGAGLGYLTGKDPLIEAGRSVGRAPSLGGALGLTSPILQSFGPTLNAIQNPLAKQAIGRTVSGIANVGEGMVIDKFTGQKTTPSSAAINFGTGALMPGQVGLKTEYGITSTLRAIQKSLPNAEAYHPELFEKNYTQIFPKELMEDQNQRYLMKRREEIYNDVNKKIEDAFKKVNAMPQGKEKTDITNKLTQMASNNWQKSLELLQDEEARKVIQGVNKLPDEQKQQAVKDIDPLLRRAGIDLAGAGVGSLYGVEVDPNKKQGKLNLKYNPVKGVAGAAAGAIITDRLQKHFLNDEDLSLGLSTKDVSKERAKQLEQNVIQEFGTTADPEKASFITSGGKYVSWGKESDLANRRMVDHREIAQASGVPSSGTDALIEYMNRTGSIRVHNAPNTPDVNIDIASQPTKDQIPALKRMMEGKVIYSDISKNDGSVLKSGTFNSFDEWFKWIKATPEGGFIKTRLLTDAAGAGVGSLLGFEKDDNNKWKYNVKKGVVGAVAGGVIAHGLGGLYDKYNEPALDNQTQGDIQKTISEETDPVKKLQMALTDAAPLNKKQAALYSAERAKRIARVAGVGENISGEQGYYAQLGQLKGSLPKVEFESIRKNIGQKDIDQLYNQVEGSDLSPFEKISAKGGLSKLLGAEGASLPTRSELRLLNQVFPEDFTQTVLDKRSLTQKLFEKGSNALNIPRSIMATADLSAPMRQGVFLIGRPKQFLPATKDMFKYAFSEDAYKGLQEDIASRPTYDMMKQSGLALTDMGDDLTSREEAFMSNLPEKIPGFGSIAKGSNRAYSGFLNKLRADTFDDLVKGAEESGMNLEENPQVVDDIAKFVNAATGRGNINATVSKASPILNATFFSPRLIASRLNLLNPKFYADLDPYVRKEALKSLFSFTGTMLTALSLAKLSGAKIGTDPRSADFGKMKFGNTRYDPWGGFQQYIVLASRLLTGQMVSSTSGKEFTLGTGYKPTTRADIIQRFFEAKTSPIASFALGLLRGKSAIGEDFRIGPELADRIIPMYMQDTYDLYKEQGPKGILWALPGMFGVGVQTYGDQVPLVSKTATGNPTISWRLPPSMGEDIINKITGKQVTTIPEDQQKFLQEAHQQDILNDIALTKAKSEVLQTGKPQTVGNKYIYLENGVVKTKALDKTPNVYNAAKQKVLNGSPINTNVQPQTPIDPNTNPVMIKIKLQSQGADAKPIVQNGTAYWLLKNNQLKEVPIENNIQQPEYTGNVALDKKLASKFKSTITARENEIADLYSKGIVSASKASQLLSDLDQQYKPKKSSSKKITLKSIKIRKPSSFAKLRIKKAKLANVKVKYPKLKIPKPRLENLKFKSLS